MNITNSSLFGQKRLSSRKVVRTIGKPDKMRFIVWREWHSRYSDDHSPCDPLDRGIVTSVAGLFV